MNTIKCPVCGTKEWKDADQFRYKPSGMAMCTGCGFVTYPKVIGVRRT